MFDLKRLSDYREGNRLEAKKATGGLPRSLWETYSAFANTTGGIILLGVEEWEDKSLHIVGVPDPESMLTNFWNTVNNPKKVSLSILLDRHVHIESIDEKKIIVIEVPRADRTLKPIYLNDNPVNGSYRRNGEGDFRCTKEMVSAMFRDNGDKTQDMIVLEQMNLDVFDYESLHRYRNSMKASRPGHVWETLEDVEFLQKLGAIGIGEDDKFHPTTAGLLMFGFEYEITREYPQFFLDYQEHFETGIRWTDRITSTSGEWSGNVNDFFFKAYNKLVQNPKIKTPFRMANGLTRLDDTAVHKALREALANCATNADFYGSRGLVIRNNLDEIVFENPGSFRVSMDEALSGGVSSPRNSIIMKMFSLLDIGERTGSGIPLIYHAWKEQGWGEPVYTEQFEPDRTILKLPILAYQGYSEQLLRVADSNYGNQMYGSYIREGSRYGDDGFGGVDVGIEVNAHKILNVISSKPNVTQKELAMITGLSTRTISREIKTLREEGVIQRIGSDRSGYWKILGRHF